MPDLVLDPQLASLQFGDPQGIDRGVAQRFVDLALKLAMFLLKLLDSGNKRHIGSLHRSSCAPPARPPVPDGADLILPSDLLPVELAQAEIWAMLDHIELHACWKPGALRLAMNFYFRGVKSGMSEQDQAEIRLEYARLKQEHSDLDAAINAMIASGCDPLQIQRMKKKKLQIKDRLQEVEDRIIPDIIA